MKQLSEIFTRYLNNNCSKDEVEMLMLHFHTEQENLLNKLVEEELNKNSLGAYNDEIKLQSSVNKVHKNLKRTISLQQTIKSKRISKRVWFNIAAAILIIVSFGTLIYVNKSDISVSKTNVAISHNPNITPGKNSATLTLGNGQKIILSDALNGEIAKEAGVKIIKTSDGAIIYSVKESDKASNQYNTLRTAKGETYMIMLPDRSKVWLNAASSLKYPANFTALKVRKVELHGEAYFEVAKEQKRPFKVITENQEVEVLGTHFNISSYDDDLITKTTLLEGSVKVIPILGFASESNQFNNTLLLPGQQSVLSQRRFNVKEVNVEEAIAWKNGYFMFDHDDIKTIMKKISRWYNVEVEYQGEIPNTQFIGTISRFQNIKQVLNKLELTKQIGFKIEGRRIIVMQ